MKGVKKDMEQEGVYYFNAALKQSRQKFKRKKKNKLTQAEKDTLLFDIAKAHGYKLDD